MRILYVEDSELDIDLTRRMLKKKAPHAQMDAVRTQREALRVMQSDDLRKYDLVLTDIHLPDGDGMSVLSHIRGRSFPLAVVVLTGQGDEQTAVAALKAGADDYIVKKENYLENLHQAMELALKHYQEGVARRAVPLKVLYIEHDTADIDLTRRYLKRHAPHIRLDVLESAEDLRKLLSKANGNLFHNIFLIDYRLPGENAIELLKDIQLQYQPRVPVVLVTGRGNEETAAQALKIGASDYVVKTSGYLHKLPSILENAYHGYQLEREHEALKSSRERLHRMVKNMPVLLIALDESGNFIFWNRECELVTDYSAQEILGNADAWNLLYPDKTYRENVRKGMPSLDSDYRNREYDISCKDGSVRTISWSNISNACRIPGWNTWAVGIDVTEQRRAEQERSRLESDLRQAQKMEAIGTLAGGIAHDFNNILASVLGYAELAMEDVRQGSELAENLNEVLTAGKRAKELVKQILTFARQSETETRPVQIKYILKEALKLLRSSIPTTIEMESKIVTEASVFADPTHIHQVIMNLCTNAAHAMEENGGKMTVELDDVVFDEETAQRFEYLMPGRHIRLAVRDTGHGMPSEIREKIFDPYFTTKKKEEGTGMGLSVVQGIVKSHDGALEVESEVGVGSTFTIYFPVSEPLASDEDLTAEKQVPKTMDRKRILFVDDEETIVSVTGLMLERLNHEITTETDSIEALRRFKSAPHRFDLVITDMTMPRMTGDKLAVEIKKIRPDIPVILCTGYSKKVFDLDYKKLGIHAIAMKPLTKFELAEMIEEVFQENGQMGEPKEGEIQ